MYKYGITIIQEFSKVSYYHQGAKAWLYRIVSRINHSAHFCMLCCFDLSSTIFCYIFTKAEVTMYAAGGRLGAGDFVGGSNILMKYLL
jgi:hypothetical protein